MNIRHYSLVFTVSTILLLAVFAGYPVKAAEDSGSPGKLVVDFTNNESRSISVRIGSADGITADMNFAVLDSSEAKIAEFYPHEILIDRFWSGPLSDIDYGRISSGSKVVRVNLESGEAASLREQVSARLAALQKERLKRRIENLNQEKSDLEELINDIDVESVGLSNELKSLRGKLKKEKALIQRQVDELQEQIDEFREERSELAEDREDLLDRRDDYSRRNNPPQDRISDLNKDIADLDRDIGQVNIEINDLRDEIRDLRDETKDIQEDIRLILEEQQELGAERRELELELKVVEREIAELSEKPSP